METRLVNDLKEPYVKGPHVRYFVSAVAIAFAIAVVLFICFVLMAQLLGL